MRTSWHDTWGCAKGPAARLAPHIRIVAGTVLFAACMVAPAATVPGTLIAAIASCCWLCACWPPARVVRTLLILGLVAFLPYFLLVPFVAPSSNATPSNQPLAIVWGVFIRGMSSLIVSVATITTLSVSDLHEGLMRLPVPGVVSAILLQIIHQTAILAYETRQVASAMAVRGASSSGLTAWRLLSSLPRVWLPRIVQRADRVTAAMELRGYCDATFGIRRHCPLRLADGIALAYVLVMLGIATAARYWNVR
jgi:energy-coupling factor transporter transmembrane protein EcfT